MKRVITLPNQRQVGLATYVKAWRQLLTMPGNEQVKGFDYFSTSAADILRAVREGLQDRINRHDTTRGHGRKWSSDYERATRHCAIRVNTPRLIVREPEIPFEFRNRLAHRIYRDD